MATNICSSSLNLKKYKQFWMILKSATKWSFTNTFQACNELVRVRIFGLLNSHEKAFLPVVLQNFVVELEDWKASLAYVIYLVNHWIVDKFYLDRFNFERRTYYNQVPDNWNNRNMESNHYNVLVVQRQAQTLFVRVLRWSICYDVDDRSMFHRKKTPLFSCCNLNVLLNLWIW